MLQELSQSKELHVRHGLSADPNEDVGVLLRAWDEALTETAETFHDHFYQLHYATIAAIYYERDIISPAIMKHGPEFRHFYAQALRRTFEPFMANLVQTKGHLNGEGLIMPGEAPSILHHHRAPPDPPPIDHANLELATAETLLATDAILSTRFYHRDQDSAVSGFWRVEAIHQKKTRQGTSAEFEVIFDGDEDREDVLLLLPKKDVVDLMLASCTYADTL
ncbi:hypothetical protein DFH09DRAFT_200447 [Mycena vulgaris]|nr:hypothetical protein DFH09DRAFT_200447 [Mycena vulgaris]